MTDLIFNSRRGFITGLASLVAAPAIVRVSSLMPVKVLIDAQRVYNWNASQLITYGRLMTRVPWIYIGGQLLIDVIPQYYDTKNNDA